MIYQKFEANDSGAHYALIFIQEELEKRNILPSERNKALLLAEETFVKLAQHADENTKIQVTIKTLFKTTRIYLQSIGEEFNLQTEIGEQNFFDLDDSVDNSAQDYIRNLLFKRFEDSLSYKNKNRENTVRITAHHKQVGSFVRTLSIIAIAIAVGLLLTNFAPESVQHVCHDSILEPIKKIYLAALSMIVGPVVFFSIASSTSSFGNLASLGRIGLKVISLYILTSIIAFLLACGINYGTSFLSILNMNFQGGESITAQPETISLIDTFVSIIPSNFIKPFIEGNMLQIIFLGVFCGIAVGLIGDYSKTLKQFFNACNELFLEFTIILSKCIPAFIFVSFILIIMDTGAETLKSLGALAAYTIGGYVILVIAYMILTLIFTRTNPIPLVKKYFTSTALTVFALSSSNASMPLNMKFCEERLGVSKKVCSFSIPLGATINMDGLTMFTTITALYFARACGIELNFNDYASFGVAVLLLSMGTPGVPGAAAVMITVLFKQLGLPLEILGMGLALVALIDMPLTVLNTTGDVAASFIAAKSENMVDMKKYQAP